MYLFCIFYLIIRLHCDIYEFDNTREYKHLTKEGNWMFY
jgi:hypothetical protein